MPPRMRPRAGVGWAGRGPDREASVAQMVERKTLNLVVVGSIPTGGAFWPPGPSGPGECWAPGRTAVLGAALAQLGERQTEDLKVPGSIPGGGTFCFPARVGRGPSRRRAGCQPAGTYGLVGYDASFTRRRSPVRSWVGVLLTATGSPTRVGREPGQPAIA